MNKHRRKKNLEVIYLILDLNLKLLTKLPNTWLKKQELLSYTVHLSTLLKKNAQNFSE